MLDNNSFEKFIIDITPIEKKTRILEKINTYKEMLIDENSRINLVSKTTLADIDNRHFLDSAQLMPLIMNKNKTLLDVGTGAGLP